MKQLKLATWRSSVIVVATFLASASAAPVFAGGLLTNTNQSIAFLRNPAREAAIGIDGVYSNPAGVAFLSDGFHFGLNWQCAVQTRTVEETSVFLDHTLQGNQTTQRYRGHATAPFIPSIAAGYNKGKWSFQFNFAVAGGGGKCQYENGLGAFEGQVGKIATALSSLDAKGYGVDCYMEGRQYYFGVTLGAAYKITPNLSVYGGLRAMIANASYEAQMKNIQVATSKGLLNLGDFIDNNPYLDAQRATLATSKESANAVIAQTQAIHDKYASQYDAIKAGAAAGNETYQKLLTALDGYTAATAGLAQIAEGEKKVAAAQTSLEGQLNPYRDGIDLSSDQTGFGIAPLIGVDWKIWRFNLAAKYEFRTRMSLKNKSNLATSTMAATAQYQDGVSVREDCPALLAFGVQYSPVDIVRVNLGYHHFYDRQAKKTYYYREDETSLTSSIVRSDEKNKLLAHGTNEYLGGVEVDVTDRLIVSAGAQITRYGMTDEYMSDQSFVTNSWSFGFGASYQANKNVKIEAAYFKTLYDHYKGANNIGGTSDFSRTNDVIGVGLVVDL